jgi:hypothetical protein
LMDVFPAMISDGFVVSDRRKKARNRGREWAAALAVRFEPTALAHTARKKGATAELEA